VAAFEEALLADHGGAVETMTLVEAVVEVTEDGVGEGDGVALDPVGLDMAAEIGGVHGVLLGTPWGGKC
jgi:hypothetical protein